jgi:hypothetical protein
MVKKFQQFIHEKPLNEWKGEYFNFLTLNYDVEKAQEMIEKERSKFCDPKGEPWETNLDDYISYVSTMTPEQEKELKAGKAITMKMGVGVDYKHAMEIDEKHLEEPGIWVVDKVNGGEFSMLIDGWHRAYARWKKGMKTMKVYLFSDPKDVKKIRMH